MEEWKIQSRSPECNSCQKPFEGKDSCFTVLSTNREGLTRQDLCQSCWQESGGNMIRDRVGVISYWQGAYEAPPPAPVDPLPKEDAESLLRKMIDRNDPAEKETRYILAIMLERKKILRHRETQNSGEKILIYEHTKTGEVLAVADPDLHLDQMYEFQRRVATMLKPQSGPVTEVPVAVES